MLPSSRNLRSVRSMVVAAFMFGQFFLAGPQQALAQWPWSYITVVPPYTSVPSSTINALTGTCTAADGSSTGTNEVPDGGFVKTNTTLRTDAWVTTAGQCERRIFGIFYDYEYHYVSPVRAEQLTPGLDPSDNLNWAPGYFNNYTPSFVLNSIPGTNPNPNPPPADNTTVAISLGATIAGEHRVRYKTFASTTSCSFPASSPYSEKTFNALACKPNWKQPGDYGTFPTNQPVQVVFPTELKDPVRAAFDGFNALLPSGGLRFTYENGENASWTHAEENYIVIQPVATCPDQADACGCNVHGNPVNGALTTASYVNMPAVTREGPGTTLASRTWAISHEIQHLLGFNHSTQTCSVMNTPPGACGTMLEGQATVPTLSDILPVIKAIYGNGSKVTCGW